MCHSPPPHFIHHAHKTTRDRNNRIFLLWEFLRSHHLDRLRHHPRHRRPPPLPRRLGGWRGPCVLSRAPKPLILISYPLTLVDHRSSFENYRRQKITGRNSGQSPAWKTEEIRGNPRKTEENRGNPRKSNWARNYEQVRLSKNILIISVSCDFTVNHRNRAAGSGCHDAACSSLLFYADRFGWCLFQNAM